MMNVSVHLQNTQVNLLDVTSKEDLQSKLENELAKSGQSLSPNQLSMVVSQFELKPNAPALDIRCPLFKTKALVAPKETTIVAQTRAPERALVAPPMPMDLQALSVVKPLPTPVLVDPLPKVSSAPLSTPPQVGGILASPISQGLDYQVAKKLGGENGAEKLSAPGSDIVWKPGNSEPALAERGASKLASKITGGTVPVAESMPHPITKADGIAQPMVKMDGLPVSGPKVKPQLDVSKLTPDQNAQLLAHFIGDYVVSNLDTHSGQFGLATGEDPGIAKGTIISIDKGQAFKFFQGSGRVRDDGTMNPSNMVEPRRPDFPVYPTLFKTLEKGGAVDLNHPAIQGALSAAENLSLSDIRSALGEYATAKYGADAEKFLAAVHQRAQGVRAEFTKATGKIPGGVSVPPPQVKAPPKLAIVPPPVSQQAVLQQVVSPQVVTPVSVPPSGPPVVVQQVVAQPLPQVGLPTPLAQGLDPALQKFVDVGVPRGMLMTITPKGIEALEGLIADKGLKTSPHFLALSTELGVGSAQLAAAAISGTPKQLADLAKLLNAGLVIDSNHPMSQSYAKNMSRLTGGDFKPYVTMADDYLASNHRDHPGSRDSVQAVRMLTPEQRVALYKYTQEKFKLFNAKVLFEVGKTKVPKTADMNTHLEGIALTKSALDSLPPYTGGNVFRGDTAKYYDDYQVGAVITRNAFTSTSKDPKAKFEGDAIIEFVTKSGKDIQGISLKPLEQEVLIPPGVSFRVAKREGGVKGGQLRLLLEEV